MTSRAEMKLVFIRLNSVNPFPEFGQGISRVPRSLAVPDGPFDEPTCLHRQATDGGVIEHIKETHSQTILLATPAGDNELLEYYTPTLSLRRWRHRIGSKRLIVKKNSTELSKVLDALSDSAVAHRLITARKKDRTIRLIQSGRGMRPHVWDVGGEMITVLVLVIGLCLDPLDKPTRSHSIQPMLPIDYSRLTIHNFTVNHTSWLLGPGKK